VVTILLVLSCLSQTPAGSPNFRGSGHLPQPFTESWASQNCFQQAALFLLRRAWTGWGVVQQSSSFPSRNVEGSNPLPSGAPVHIWPEETSRGSQIKIRFLSKGQKGFWKHSGSFPPHVRCTEPSALLKWMV
jgi:hypothetical protein